MATNDLEWHPTALRCGSHTYWPRLLLLSRRTHSGWSRERNTVTLPSLAFGSLSCPRLLLTVSSAPEPSILKVALCCLVEHSALDCTSSERPLEFELRVDFLN